MFGIRAPRTVRTKTSNFPETTKPCAAMNRRSKDALDDDRVTAGKGLYPRPPSLARPVGSVDVAPAVTQLCWSASPRCTTTTTTTTTTTNNNNNM